MEWKLDTPDGRRSWMNEALPCETESAMKTLRQDLKWGREQSLQKAAKAAGAERITYAKFKSSIRRKLWARAAVASSPALPRRQRLQAGGGVAELRGARCLTAPGASARDASEATSPVANRERYITRIVMRMCGFWGERTEEDS